MPRALALAAETGLVRDVDVDGAVYYLSQVFVTPTDAPGMRTWRKRLFAAMYRNAASPVEYFHLPRERTVTPRLGDRALTGALETMLFE